MARSCSKSNIEPAGTSREIKRAAPAEPILRECTSTRKKRFTETAISELQRPFGKKREIEEGFPASLLGAAGGVYFQTGLFPYRLLLSQQPSFVHALGKCLICGAGKVRTSVMSRKYLYIVVRL
jgi:hypothetical protein